MHIGMNMLTTAAIGSFLEKRYGTLRHAFTILWGILLVPTVYTFVAYILFALFEREGLMYQHSVGFSGVLFQLSVLEANLNPHSTRSVFGMFQVSSSAYPWAMLVLMQFLLPHVSFWGHLSGILVGTLQLYGVFDFLFPSDAYLREMEGWTWMQPLTRIPNFVSIPVEDTDRRRPRMLLESIKGLAYAGCTLCSNIAETMTMCIFGYDNTNRRREGEEESFSNVSPSSVDYDDDNQDDSLELQVALVESLSQKPPRTAEVESRIL